MLSQLRKADVACEIYPDAAKMKKQMQYANAKQVPYVVIVGETEMQESKFTLKDMQSGEQSLLTADELLEKLA